MDIQNNRTIGKRVFRGVMGVLLALLLPACGDAGPGGTLGASEAAGLDDGMRDVVLIGNSEDGTVTFLDGFTFEKLGTIDAVPDLNKRLIENFFRPIRTLCRAVVQTQKGNKTVDDMRVLPDGETLVMSRATLGDAVALDLTTGELDWRTNMVGCLADHIDVSPDGERMVVSDLLSDTVRVLDTENGHIVGSYPGGTFPHGNHYSEDGERIYTGSIGNLLFPFDLNAFKGNRWLTVVDANTLDVLETHEFEFGIRPMVLMPNEETAYIQLSYQRGFVEYDLITGEIVRELDLPASEAGEGLHPDDYPQDSAHHGIAISGDQTTLCNAGTIDDYVAIVDRDTFSFERVPSGDIPYWATTSLDGEHCLVSNSGDNNVSVIDYETAEEVTRIPVGKFPQRIRLAEVRDEVIADLFGSN